MSASEKQALSKLVVDSAPTAGICDPYVWRYGLYICRLHSASPVVLDLSHTQGTLEAWQKGGLRVKKKTKVARQTKRKYLTLTAEYVACLNNIEMRAYTNKRTCAWNPKLSTYNDNETLLADKGFGA